MKTAAPPGSSETNERERLALLSLSKWLDAEAPAALQSLVRLAASQTGCAAAAINLIDAHRLYALARHGLQSRHASREGSWCARTMAADALHIDQADDASAHWQFYAGLPIAVEGHVLATLCVMDRQHRTLTAEQITALEDLTQIAQQTLEARIHHRRTKREAARVRGASLAGSDWLWETDQEGRLQWVSEGLMQHTGLDPMAEIGLVGARDIYTPSTLDHGASWERLIQARQRREPFSHALGERLTPRGRMVVSVSGTPVFDQDGSFMGYRGASRNVTRQLTLEASERQREGLLKEATETFHAGVMISAPDGKILLANRHWLQSVGLSDVDQAPPWPTLVRHLIRQGHYLDAEGREDEFFEWRIHQHQENRARVIRLKDRVILSRDQLLSDGRILHFATDITQAHTESLVLAEQQEALQASEARLKAVLAALPDLWFVLDDKGCYRDGHRNHPMMRRPFEDMRGRTLESVVDPELASTERAAMEQAHQTGQLQRFEFKLTTADGVARQFEGRMSPMPAGRTLFLTRDMTEQRTLERDIQTLQQVLQADLSLGLLVMDATAPGHPVVYATPGNEALLKLRVAQLLGRPLLTVLRGLGDNPAGLALLDQSLSAGLPCVAMLTARDAVQDQDRTYELRLTPLKAPQGQAVSHVIGLLHDVTERQMAAERLRLSEERWKFALEGAGDGVWDWDLTNGRAFYSARCRALLGLTQEDLDDSPQALREHVHPDDLTRVESTLVQFQQEGRGILQLECRLKHRDGHNIWALLRGKVVARDAQGHPTRVVGTFSDITPIKHAERALRDKQSAEAANQAKSEFLSRMSHEIRTPLNAVHGFAQLLKQRLDQFDRVPTSPHELIEYAERILSGSEHLNELVNEVLDLQQIESGVVTLKPEWVDLHDAVNQCVHMLGPMASRFGIALRAPIEPGWQVWTDRQRLKQVLNNLVSNGIKYNRPSGEVRLSLSSAPHDAVQIMIEDTGLGMDAGQLSRLFQPFERLGRDTSAIEGTGLGLVITRSLVQAMGAEIEIRSAPNAGTRIVITLSQARMGEPPSPEQAPPVVPHPMPASPEPIMNSTAHSAEHPLRVLYIEDNRINALLFEEALRPYPYLQLEIAEDGQLALSIAREFQPEVLVVDAHLPGMSGFEVLQALRTQPGLKDVPAYMCSADALPEDLARAAREGFVGYWTKPIDIPLVISTLSALASQDPDQAHNAAS